MECNFVVGQRVVCKIPRWYLNSGPGGDFRYPELGETYVITRMRPGLYRNTPTVFLGFAEFGTNDYCYSGFAPVHERKTDISCFEEILRRVNAGEPVVVETAP